MGTRYSPWDSLRLSVNRRRLTLNGRRLAFTGGQLMADRRRSADDRLQLPAGALLRSERRRGGCCWFGVKDSPGPLSVSVARA